MGFDWGRSDIPTAGRDGWWNERPERGWDTYTGRPLPPWPPAHVRGTSFSCCLACPHKRPRCADCPADIWEGRVHDAASTPTPERREPLLKRLIKKVKR